MGGGTQLSPPAVTPMLTSDPGGGEGELDVVATETQIQSYSRMGF